MVLTYQHHIENNYIAKNKGELMKNKKDFSKLPKKSTKNIDKEKHLIRLVRLMITLGQGVLNLEKIAEECNVSTRTILRDINILESAGLPIYKPSERERNYRIDEDFSLPHFHVTKENAAQFAAALKALAHFVTKPQELILPVQKAVAENGLKHLHEKAERRSEKLHNWDIANVHATNEKFNSMWIQNQFSSGGAAIALATLRAGYEIFDQETKNHALKKWNMEQAQKTLVRLEYLSGDTEGVLEDCQNMIKDDPKDAWPYYTIGLTYYENKDFDNALKYLAEGLKYQPNDKNLNLCCALIFEGKQCYEQAIQYFAKACPTIYVQLIYAVGMYCTAAMPGKAKDILEKNKADISKREYNTLKGLIEKRTKI